MVCPVKEIGRFMGYCYRNYGKQSSSIEWDFSYNHHYVPSMNRLGRGDNKYTLPVFYEK